MASLNGIDADQIHIDTLDEEVNRMDPASESYVRQLRKLSKLCGSLGRFPSSHVLLDEVTLSGQYPYSYGGFSDVWKAQYGGGWVAIKVLRIHAADQLVMKKAFCHEVTYWKRLNHPHIVRFLGVSSKFYLSIVSEWMPNGDLLSYLEAHPDMVRLTLIGQVASAVEYVHSSHVVHGDIKGRNILINNYGQACLSDFGLAVTVYNTQTLDSMRSDTGSSTFAGTIRWSAPERLLPSNDPRYTMPTTASDVYSFGITMWEVLTLQILFKDLRYNWQVMQQILNGLRPPKLSEISNGLWSLIEDSWTHEQHHRPSSAMVAMRLREELAREPPSIPSREQGPQLAIDHQVLRSGISTPGQSGLATSKGNDQLLLVNTQEVSLCPTDVARIAESSTVHTDMFRKCISVMTAALRFNISNSATSYASNSEQPTPHGISEVLHYSCLHWIDHLEGCGDLPITELADLSELICTCFLYWLEVLSATTSSQAAPSIMSRLVSWMAKHPNAIQDADAFIQAKKGHSTSDFTARDLQQFAVEARAFINAFAVPIKSSCPHIYLSALASTSKQSKVWCRLLKIFGGIPATITQQQQDVCFTLRGHENYVLSVGFSPDGTRIVSGSSDKTIRLWDAATGEAVREPLRGHEGVVLSVALSPDGTRIVSSSSDETIRLWDAATGEAVGEPLHGHENWVRSVAFSPDGTRIVSGSDDKTICLWNAATGEVIGEPLRGHENWVRSVAFSPDGMRIVSGSSDKTVRLWDAATGVAIGKPLRGHEDYVLSVEFSPDGTRIVSGSSDKTIRVWHLATRAAIGKPLRGHEDWVRTVAFSPDGTRIVSGSDDKTIHLWDAATGDAIGERLYGHENSVCSVEPSPDGTRIVSCSLDKTIRLWDAPTGEATGESLRGHEGSFLSMRLSVDGMRIISGSSGKTICLWDAATGSAVEELMRGRESIANVLAVSPDGAQVVLASSDGQPHREHADACDPLQNLFHHANHLSTDSEFNTGRLTSMKASHPGVHPIPGIPANRVAFSRKDAHSTCIDHLLVPGRDPRDTFTLDEDGWLRGPNGELFLWVLPEYRAGLWWPRTTAIMGTHPVMLDLSRFHHGEVWAKCFSGDADDVH